MKRKLVIIAGVFSVLLLAAVCLLPWPARINVKMYGIIASESDEAIREVQFTVTGWKRNYLLRRDKLKVDIAFCSDGEEPFIKQARAEGFLSPRYTDYYWAGYSAYQLSESRPVAGIFALSADLDCCILTDVSGTEDYYIVGSITPNFDLDSILAVFEEGFPKRLAAPSLK